jgi:sugar transferase (PEP-CTERM system associated)
MLRVLQHFIPVRTALLVLSEALLLASIIALGMSLHLWNPTRDLRLGLAHQGYSVDDALWKCVQSSMVFAGLGLVSIGFNQLYDFRISASPTTRAARFVESVGTALALSLVAIYFAHLAGLVKVLGFPGLELSQRVQTLVASMGLAFGVVYLWRNAYHWAMRRLDLDLRVLILGSRHPAHSLAREILDHPEAGYEVVGLVAEPEPVAAGGAGNRVSRVQVASVVGDAQTRALVLPGFLLPSAEEKVLGSGIGSEEGESLTLLDVVEREKVDVVVVAIQDRRLCLPTQDLLRSRLAGIDIREREEIYEQITGKLAVEAMRPSYLIFNEGFRRHPWTELVKRTFDVVFALLILALFWPVMLVTALLVRFDSPGPALFKQERVGQDGRIFTLMKFRSMRADAEKDTGPVWSSQHDPRITRFGRLMRKTRVDELPQLFNVLAGAMSLVGPRPERAHFVQDLATKIPYYNQRHTVKPGLTGWAQINHPYGNTEEDALYKLQYDLFYIKNHSLLFDLSILFNTIKTVLLRQGT